MKLNKSPGIDGLSVEFYKTFWTQINTHVVKSLNEGYMKGELSDTQKQGTLSLIHKKDDPLNLDNWRPITLLNVDYKLAASALAQRLKLVLPKIIHTDQNGFVEGRYIGHNIRQIQDIIDFADETQIEGAILFLDFKKAFDTVEWNFMLDTLEHFGFQSSFINWVKTLYKNVTNSVINNGWRSESFTISRGIRQGCPLSALIFIIVAEILAIRIRTNTDVEGIAIPGQGHLKIAQLADDTTLFVKSEREILLNLEIVDDFSRVSGLDLNRTKTEGLWIGKSKRQQHTNVAGIKWPETPIKSLGVYFGHDKNECMQLNWIDKIEKAQVTLNRWKKRKLTIFGRITIVKSLLLPKFTYVASVSSPTGTIVQSIEQMIYGFIWEGKRDKIKRTTMIGQYEQGGLNVCGIKSHFDSLRIKWIKRLTNNDHANWKAIPTFYLNKFGKHFLIFKMQMDTIKCLPNIDIIPPFYRDVLNSWIKCGGGQTKLPTTFYDIRQQVIWGNKLIQHKGKSLLFKSWIDSGILTVNDLINETGHLSEAFILSKLKSKTNWISEFVIMRTSIPSWWWRILNSDNSIRTAVNTKPTIKLKTKGVDLHLDKTDNNLIYQLLVQKTFCKPFVKNMWCRRLAVPDSASHWISVYNYIFKGIEENKLREYKVKLLHNILPCTELLYRWKIADTPYCNTCGGLDNYEHFFVTCNSLTSFWVKVTRLLEATGFSKKLVSLKSIVLGYRVDNNSYLEINYFLTIVGFSIYKSYYVSELRTKPVDIYALMKRELSYRLAVMSHRDTKLGVILKTLQKECS
jgi:hypothetical protein